LGFNVSTAVTVENTTSLVVIPYSPVTVSLVVIPYSPVTVSLVATP
jgi:hypothetical protein